MSNNKKTETIDLTPTWAGLMPALIAVLQDGNAEGQKLAKEELMKLARYADQQNELLKRIDKTI